MLVNVHVVGGSKDLALHLKVLTQRIPATQRPIEIMRGSGYPGHDNSGLNSKDRVDAHLRERHAEKYAEKYGEATCMPQVAVGAARHLEKARSSIVQDKVATPPEPAQVIEDWVKTASPH